MIIKQKPIGPQIIDSADLDSLEGGVLIQPMPGKLPSLHATLARQGRSPSRSELTRHFTETLLEDFVENGASASSGCRIALSMGIRFNRRVGRGGKSMRKIVFVLAVVAQPAFAVEMPNYHAIDQLQERANSYIAVLEAQRNAALNQVVALTAELEKVRKACPQK